MMTAQAISLDRVRENNLKDIVLELPRHAIVAIVGVSGSGKSSLLFRTLAAESAARHEAVTTTAARRTFARRPDADRIEGLPYCVTVTQRAIHRSPRSTIATFTGIHDALRSLVITSGEILCTCGATVPPPSPQTLADFLLAAHPSSQAEVGAVIVRSRSAGLREELGTLREEGFDSVLVQTDDAKPRRERQLDGLRSLNREHRNTVTVLLGSQRVGDRTRDTLLDLLERAHLRGRGDVYVRTTGRRTADPFELETGIAWPCPACHTLYPRPTASLLSFNADETRSGRCRGCDGIGVVQSVALETLVPDPTLSIGNGCFNLNCERGSYKHLSIREDVVRGLCLEHGQTASVPFASLSEKLRQELLYGAGKRRIQPLDVRGRKSGAKVIYHGLIPSLRKLTGAEGPAGDYARSYVTSVPCEVCGGTRFDRERVDYYHYRRRSFTEILSDTTLSAREFLRDFEAAAGGERRLLRLLVQTLEALVRSGLGYVRLDRSTSSLSGGELQRLKIAGSLCSGLTQCCYVLDEPSLGLHAIDNRGLIETIGKLRDLGNTILLADHDTDFRQAADLIVELGPGGGSRGGEVVYVGEDRTRGRLPDEPARIRRRPARLAAGAIRVHGCTAHNLRDITVKVPLGGLVCLTGVSGSGKSSFAHHVLFPAVNAFLQSRRTSGPTWSGLEGADAVRAIARVGQQAIGASITSLVATYLGIYDRIRELFAESEVAQARAYTPAHFSYNRPEGRCPVCTGRGSVSSGERSSDRVECPACGGSRFVDAVLDVRHRGLSVGDVLQLDIDRSMDVFGDETAVTAPLRLLRDLGLGHLQLGRPTTTLSGGEAQRLKLGYALSQLGGHPEGLVFILDEPTAGLHRSDVQALIDSFDRIIDGGKNTLLVIEHDLDVIGIADHIVDLGPGAGGEGGRVVYAGPPAGAVKMRASRTGEALRARSASARTAAGSLRSHESPQGIQSEDTVSPQVADLAERFLQRVRNEETEEVLGEQEASLLAPTYLLTGEPSGFPLGNRTVLENLRLSDLLFRVIGSLVRQPEQEGITSLEHAADAYPKQASEVLVGFSPVSALLESRRATRTALRETLRQASERGFTEYINARGTVCPTAAVSDADTDSIEGFTTRVVAGKVGRGNEDTKTILARALEAGGGWVTLYRGGGRGGTVTEIRHIADRPLDVHTRRLGRRRCVPGIFDRHDAGACPFCRGSGNLPSLDLALVVANRRKSPCDTTFFHPDCEALLRAVWGRMTAALRFLDEEGLASPVNARSRWDVEDWGILCHGYPWGRFLIPGRSGGKNIDYYEWNGLIPLVLGRLHLSKSRRWASGIEASRGTVNCFSCEGTGFDWLARHYHLGEHPVSEWLTGRTHGNLFDFLTDHASKEGCRALLGSLEQVVKAGLGGVRIGATCGELSEEDRRRVRSLAVCQLGFAEGTYCIRGSEKVNAAHKAETEFLRLAAVDRKVIMVGNAGEGT